MFKKRIAVIAIMVPIAVFIIFGLGCSEPPPPEIVEQEPPYRAYLKKFLAESRLTFIPVIKNDFAYYELYTADQQLAGFVFLGTEEGYTGPINLFVKTDTAGIIQRLQIWEHTETPIYVMEMDAFLATFADYKAEAELIWQKDVQGITGATITAEAIIAAVYEPGKTAYQKGIFTREE